MTWNMKFFHGFSKDVEVKQITWRCRPDVSLAYTVAGQINGGLIMFKIRLPEHAWLGLEIELQYRHRGSR